MMTRNTDWTRKVSFWAAPLLLLAAAMWIGAPVSIDAVEDMEREKIIVEFAAPALALDGEDAVLPEGRADIAARILSRLGAQVRESARVFEFLPLIALEADAETMLRLIAMPEVVAIQPDRELEVLPSPALVDSFQKPPATSPFRTFPVKSPFRRCPEKQRIMTPMWSRPCRAKRRKTPSRLRLPNSRREAAMRIGRPRSWIVAVAASGPPSTDCT